MSRWCCTRAKSEAINKTISEIESAFGILVLRSKIPSESRRLLIAELKTYFEKRVVEEAVSEIESALILEVEKGDTPSDTMANLRAVLEKGFDPDKCEDYFYCLENNCYKKFDDDDL